MTEALEKALQRRAQSEKQTEESVNGPSVNSVADIQEVLQELDPSNSVNASAKTSTLNVDLDGTLDGDKKQLFNVSVDTSSRSHRSILLDGFRLLKSRKEHVESMPQQDSLVINGRVMKPPKVMAGDDSVISIDPIIKRLLGAYRDGQYICWDLKDGYTYFYEIFEHRLTRKQTENKSVTSAGLS